MGESIRQRPEIGGALIQTAHAQNDRVLRAATSRVGSQFWRYMPFQALA